LSPAVNGWAGETSKVFATCRGFSSYAEFVRVQGGVMQEANSQPENKTNVSMIYRGENRMSEFSEDAKECGRKIADAASRASDYIEDKARVVGDKFKDFQGKNFSEIADEAKDYARRKPGQAILISAAAGLVLGFLLRNGRRFL
jgi:ElaB/YqjD/DUF883 family membrane-anchored ribosome-binding protein